MKFSKIAVTKKGVELTRETRDANGCVEEIHLNSPERPMPSFDDAMQAFLGYVEELLDGTIDIDSEAGATVTTLNFSEDKNGLRGLIVTAIVPIEKAYDKPIVLNTPLVREGGELPLEDAFILDDEVLALIKDVEKEATAYAGGKRKRESAVDTPSENAKNFDTRAAAASTASTRTPKKSAKQHASNGANGKRPTAKKKGTGARPRVKQASDAALDDVLDKVEPDYEIVDETWVGSPPPKVDDAGAQAVRDAAAGVQ